MEGLKEVDELHRRQLRAMNPGEKLAQIGRLMASAPLFDLSRRDASDQRVRELWQELRRRMAEK